MSRVKAPRVTVGSLNVDVEWRDMGYDSGVAVSVSLADEDESPIAKFDAFKIHPHWHQSLAGGREVVYRIQNHDAFEEVMVLLQTLRELTRTAGLNQVADAISDSDIDLVIKSIDEAVRIVRP